MAADDFGVQMPYNMEAEQAVLGSVLIDPGLVSAIRGLVRPDDFYLPQHQAVCKVIYEQDAAGSRVDPLTVLDQLERDEVYDEAGGRNYLFQMAQAVPTTANVESYAGIVAWYSRARKAYDGATEISEAALARTLTPEELAAHAEKMLELADMGDDQEDGLEKFLASLGQKKPRILSGIPEIDRKTGGLRLPSLLTIGAAPGTGKTDIALQIALNLQRDPEAGKVVFFSVEMDSEQIYERVSSIMLQIDYGRFTDQDITPAAAEKIEPFVRSIKPWFRLYDDVDNINRMQGIVAKEKPSLVVIDYAQIVSTDGATESRRLEVDNIIRKCKAMAKRNRCCVILLSQLRKQERPGQKPNNDDLKETGAFVECSDYIFLLYRPFVYSRDPSEVHVAELFISKNKFGATGNVDLYFQGEFQRFIGVEDRFTEPPPASQADFEEIFTEGDVPW